LIFEQRWNPAKKTLTSAIVTLEEVSGAIAAYNKANPQLPPMSTRNLDRFHACRRT